MVELIAVTAILAILATVAAPLLSTPVGEAVLSTQSLIIAQEIRRTQQLAITSGTNHRFEVNVVNRTYAIRNANPFVAPVLAANMDRQIVEVRSNLRDYGGGWRGIEYTPTGLPSQTGEIVLFDSRGRGRAIIAAVGSGRIRIEVRTR